MSRKYTSYNIVKSTSTLRLPTAPPHPFIVNPSDDYLCLKCKKPRALHSQPEIPAQK